LARFRYECLLKFSACLALADLLQAKPDHLTEPNREVVGERLDLLLDPRGLPLGKWYKLLLDAVKALEEPAVADTLSSSGRVLPRLVGSRLNTGFREELEEATCLPLPYAQRSGDDVRLILRGSVSVSVPRTLSRGTGVLGSVLAQ